MLTIDASTFRSRRTGGSLGDERSGVCQAPRGRRFCRLGGESDSVRRPGIRRRRRRAPWSSVEGKLKTLDYQRCERVAKFGADQQHEGVEVFWHQEPGAADPIVDGSRLAMRGLGSDQAGQAPAAGESPLSANRRSGYWAIFRTGCDKAPRRLAFSPFVARRSTIFFRPEDAIPTSLTMLGGSFGRREAPLSTSPIPPSTPTYGVSIRVAMMRQPEPENGSHLWEVSHEETSLKLLRSCGVRSHPRFFGRLGGSIRRCDLLSQSQSWRLDRCASHAAVWNARASLQSR